MAAGSVAAGSEGFRVRTHKQLFKLWLMAARSLTIKITPFNWSVSKRARILFYRDLYLGPVQITWYWHPSDSRIKEIVQTTQHDRAHLGRLDKLKDERENE